MRRLTLALLPLLALGCRDLSRFSSSGDHFEGPVALGSFVRANVADGARLCITLDASHLQDQPGHISTSDGRFRTEPLRPIPQVWHDPLSTLTFGEGRDKNLLYIATPTNGGPDGGEVGDVMVFVSLMSNGAIEVRLVRGAPGADPAGPTPPSNLFAIFQLTRTPGTCSF